MIELDDIKVRIRDRDGKYLAGDSVRPWFATDLAQARVFDYEQDHVEATLALIAHTEGVILEAIPLEPQEFLEVCDGCQKMVAPQMAFFDGKAFLCGTCRRQKRRLI
jgi:hypothetical protein